MAFIKKKFIGAGQVSSNEVDASIALTSQLNAEISRAEAAEEAAQDAADAAQSAADAAQSAAEAAQADADDLITLSGRPASSEDLGTFSGSTIPDSSDIKEALQSLETALESIPDPITYKGVYNATTDSPALDNSDTGKAGWLYKVTTAGSQDFGAGSISFAVGDQVVNNGTIWDKWDMTDAVTSVNGQAGAVTLVTDDIAEDGSPTNLWFTTARAKAAAVADSITDGVTDVAPSQNAVFDALALKASITYVDGKVLDSIADSDTTHAPSRNAVFDALALKSDVGHTHVAADVTDFTAAARAAAVVNSTAGSQTDQAASVSSMKSYVTTAIAAIPAAAVFFKETKTLNGTDITNQYVDLAHTPTSNSLSMSIDGVMQYEGEDYSLSGLRVTFLNGLATGGVSALVSGDKLRFHYMY